MGNTPDLAAWIAVAVSIFGGGVAMAWRMGRLEQRVGDVKDDVGDLKREVDKVKTKVGA
jgi:hypothetical protein